MSLFATVPAIDPSLCPPEVIGAGALGQRVFDGTDTALLLQGLRARLQSHPAPAAALDLGLGLLFAGQRETALAAQAQALAQQPLYRVVGLQPPLPPRLRVLALAAPGDLMVNTPLEFILTGSAIGLDLLYLQPGAPLPTAVPEHDVAFIAVCQSEESDAALRRLIPLAQAWPRPVVNQPAQLLRLARETACQGWENIPGLAFPPTRRVSRPTVEAWAAAGAAPDWPFIIRPLGAHAGHGLAKIEAPARLAAYLAAAPEVAEFYAAPYVDYRSPDGQFRKYRIVFIDRHPYLCHLAIGRDWMMHYVNADMAANAANRAEEARVMESFDHDFLLRHAGAFAALNRRFDLDYYGIDCAETREGKLLIFEVASAMVIHAMDSPQLYPYKQAQMQKTFAAFHRLLARVAAGAPAPAGPVPLPVAAAAPAAQPGAAWH